MSAVIRSLAVIAASVLCAVGARAEVLFPPETAACYVGAPASDAPDATAAKRPAVPVTAVRLERSFAQLAYEQTQAPRKDGGRLVNVRVLVTFADASKSAVKRFANGPYELLRCTDDVCDAGNYRIERQADGAVLLRMTGGMVVGGGDYRGGPNRQVPDGQVFRLTASANGSCK